MDRRLTTVGDGAAKTTAVYDIDRKGNASEVHMVRNDNNRTRPRICMPTARSFRRMAFRGTSYEAQDVLAAVDHVDLVGLEPGPWFRVMQALQKRLLWRDASNRVALLNPGLKSIPLAQSYDAMIVVCQDWLDLVHVNSIVDWRGKCGTTLCYVEELYARDLELYRHWLPALARFDHVVLSMRGSIEAVEKAIGKKCHHVPLGIDATRFSPYPDPPPRVVDFYSIGRRWPGLHQALLDYSSKNGSFYVYDTIADIACASTISHGSHRDALAGVAKRSKFFVVGPAKHDTSSQTGGQQEIGYRYFEGAAAGTVMIGQGPDSSSFRELFDWPEAVVPVRPDGSDIAEVLESFRDQPDRLDRISRRNAREVLLRHDWVYRWKEILAIIGLEPTERMRSRMVLLQESASTLDVAGRRSWHRK